MFRILFLASILISGSANAFPLVDSNSVWPGEQAVDNRYGFEGIVALNNCSGSLIRFTHSVDTDAAMVLTNGHCLSGGMPSPGVVYFNQDVKRSMSLLHPTNASSVGRVNAVKILYATMTKTDVAIYVLKETYQEIAQNYSIQPLTLADKKASLNEGIEVISGYWKRGYSCQIDAFIPTLKESGWTMNDSIRYSRPGCETIGGTSGSPIISKTTKEVIGVNNTGNENGQKCTMNNPCEVDEQGNVTFEKGRSYGQQTYWFYTCFNAQKQLDLNVPGCMLAK